MKNTISGIQRLYRNSKVLKYGIIIFFIFATLFFFSRIFFGLDFSDSFYHLNQASQKESENSFTFFLSSLIIDKFLTYTRGHIILLRLINALLIFISVCIPILLFPKKVNKNHFLFLAGCTLILTTTLNSNILGFDTLSVFFASIIFMMTFSFFRNRSIYFLMTIAVLSALNVFIRLPNIYLLPVIFSTILIQGFNETKLRKSQIILIGFIYFTVTSILVLLGYIIYFNSGGVFPKALFEDKYHSPTILISNYSKDLLILFSFIIFILINYFIMENIWKIEGKLQKGVSFFILGTFSFIIIFKYIMLSKYSLNFSLMITAMAISFVMVHLYKSKEKNVNSILYLFILFLFLIPFGSNTGLLKSSLLIVLLPFISILIKFERNKILIIIFLLPISIIEGIFNVYEDENIYALNSIPEIKGLNPILTSEKRSEYLMKVCAEVNDLKKKEYSVYFYGNKSHIFHFLYNDTSIYQDYFQPLDNPDFFNEVRSKVKTEGKIAIFIVDSYPDHDSNIQDTNLILGLEYLNFQRAGENLVYYIYP